MSQSQTNVPINFEESKKIALTFKDKGKYQEALGIYTNILQSNSNINRTQVLDEASTILRQMGDNKEAIKILNESVQLQKTADKYCVLADLHNQIQQPLLALQNYSKALKIKDKSIQPQTKQFLQNSIIFKNIAQIQGMVKQHQLIQSKLTQQTTSDVEQLLRESNRTIATVLKYQYNEDLDKTKKNSLQELQKMLIEMKNRIDSLQEQNKKIREEQAHFYKNHQYIFNESLDNTTLSHENKQILKLYFTTFCNKMQLYFMCLKLLNKIPDSGLSLTQVYKHCQNKEQILVQIQHKLKYYMDHADKAKGVIDQIPYVGLVFSIFKQLDKYFTKYVEKVHEQHKINVIVKTWMNNQVFNDFVGDIASRLTLKMKLRILNYEQSSFKNYLKLLYSKLIKKYKFKWEAQKIKELDCEKYDRKVYISKLAERDAGMIFYAFEMERLKRSTDMEKMTHQIIQFIEEVDNIKIQAEQVETVKEQKGKYCLLF